MNEQDIYDLLNKKNIKYEITKHDAVFTMNDLYNSNIPYPECDAKNIFVRDDKKQKYYLITVKGNKKVDLKNFRKLHNTRPLSFANETELFEKLNLHPGSVTPFGLLNNTQKDVEFFIDKSFWQNSNMIGIHPNINTATVWLNVDDLIKLLKDDEHNIFIDEL